MKPSLGIRDRHLRFYLMVLRTVPFVWAAKLAMLGISCMFGGLECMTGANHSEIYRAPNKTF